MYIAMDIHQCLASSKTFIKLPALLATVSVIVATLQIFVAS